MKELIGVITSLLDGLDLRGRWVALAGFVALLLLAVYFLEYSTGWNYYRSMSAKLTILERLNALSASAISDNPDLYPVYKQLVLDLAARHTAPVPAPEFSFPTSIGDWKAVTGALLWVVLAILGLFGAFGKDIGIRVVAAVFLAALAVVFGYIGSVLPTIVNYPWVNYVGFPALQLVGIFMWSNVTQRKKALAQKPI